MINIVVGAVVIALMMTIAVLLYLSTRGNVP